MPPDLIAGRYRVEREVGRGGMGMVWLCRDERLDRDVAVKQVGGLPGESSMHFARALREARHSAALNHPHVVAIFDAIEEGNVVWLVMEYVPSRTLSQIIKGRRTDISGASRSDRRAGRRRTRGGARARHHPPRRQAEQHPGGRGETSRRSPTSASPGPWTRSSSPAAGWSSARRRTSPRSRHAARSRRPPPTSGPWAPPCTPRSRAGPSTRSSPTRSRCSGSSPRRARLVLRGPGTLGRALARMLDPDPDARWTMAEAARELRGLGMEKVVPEDERTKVFAPAASDRGGASLGSRRHRGTPGAGGRDRNRGRRRSQSVAQPPCSPCWSCSSRRRPAATG